MCLRIPGLQGEDNQNPRIRQHRLIGKFHKNKAPEEQQKVDPLPTHARTLASSATSCLLPHRGKKGEAGRFAHNSTYCRCLQRRKGKTVLLVCTTGVDLRENSSFVIIAHSRLPHTASLAGSELPQMPFCPHRHPLSRHHERESLVFFFFSFSNPLFD